MKRASVGTGTHGGSREQKPMEGNSDDRRDGSPLRVSILLVGAAGLSGAWVVGFRSWFPHWHGFPNTASTTLLFLLAACFGKGAPRRFQWSVVAGLGFSAMGDAFLMSRGDHFVVGLASFLVAHLWYLWAFTSDTRLALHKAPFVIWALWGLVLVLSLWPGIPRALRLPVMLYSLALVSMAAQAMNRAVLRRDTSAVLAAVGAGLFVLSDSVLACGRFGHPVEGGRIVILGTYFAAQAGITLSVVLHRNPPNDRTF